jgi:hypothetical protein
MSCAGHALEDDCVQGMGETPDLVSFEEDEGSAEDSDPDNVVATLYNFGNECFCLVLPSVGGRDPLAGTTLNGVGRLVRGHHKVETGKTQA